MNKIIKRTFCTVLAAIMMTGTFMTADAARKCTKNNTGNSCKYQGSIDISLGIYTHKANYGAVCSDHVVKYSKPTVTFSPCNGKTDRNKVRWYAEWKESGQIKDSITDTYTLKNNEEKKRDLSDGMKWSTWDSDITYFRTDIYPWMSKVLNSVDKAKNNAYFSDVYKRRASTNITH